VSALAEHILDDGSRPFDAETVEADLRNMWKRGGPGTDPARDGAIHRAAMPNLVVPLDPPFAMKLTPVLVELTRQHPSRLFTIGAGAASKGGGLVARIGVIRHRRESGGGLICSEQVVLDSDPDSVSLIPSAIRSLLIGDLPTVLLHFHPRIDLPWFEELVSMADLILVDSCLVPPGREPEAWRFVEREGSRRVHDLAWTRLLPWRAILAEVFDDKEYLPALGAVRAVEIAFTGPGPPPPPAWLFAGWLATRLGWKVEGGDARALRLESKSGPVTIAFRGSGSGQERILEKITITADGTHALVAEIRHQGRDRTARVTVRGQGESSSEVPFGYCEFAACIVGEIHRHAANRPMEQAARAAEEMMNVWSRS